MKHVVVIIGTRPEAIKLAPVISALGKEGMKTKVCVFRQHGNVLDETLRDHLPHKLAHYLYELCQRFNTFYNTDTIVQAEEPARSLRLFLTRVTADVLRSGASLLTIRVPDRM